VNKNSIQTVNTIIHIVLHRCLHVIRNNIQLNTTSIYLMKLALYNKDTKL